jgi:hypothetical protein
MDPRKPENLEIILQEDRSASQKLGELVVGVEIHADVDYLAKLESLMERVKKFAKPLPAGKIDDAKALTNLITPRLPIAQTEKGALELGFFIYNPRNDAGNSSLNAQWFLPGRDMPRMILQEYLSPRSFNREIAAFREDSPQVLALLEESVEAYEEAPRVLAE